MLTIEVYGKRIQAYACKKCPGNAKISVDHWPAHVEKHARQADLFDELCGVIKKKCTDCGGVFKSVRSYGQLRCRQCSADKPARKGLQVMAHGAT